MTLDDLEVRKLAQKFFESEKLRKEEWIPAVAGLNVKGNYIKNCTPDPCRLILREEKNDSIFSAR
jgi:hypothetical protein